MGSSCYCVNNIDSNDINNIDNNNNIALDAFEIYLHFSLFR